MRRRAYAITTGRAPRPRTRGVSAEPLHVIRAAGIGAVVGSTMRMPAASPRTLGAYHAVMQRLWQELPAVLPLRFGVAVDEEALVDILRARAQAWRARLAAVRGRAQMTLRLFDDADPAAGPTTAPPTALGPPSGTAYLRARALRAARERDSRVLTQLRPAVRRWVRAERVERRGSIVTAYHLVPRRSATAYRSAVLEASRRAQVRVHVTGPFAPYAFADEPSLSE